MEEGDRLTDRLAAALNAVASASAIGGAPRRGRRRASRSAGAIWRASSAEDLPLPAEVKADRDLPRALRAGAPDVLVVGRVSATLLRALRAHPPALLIVTADLEPDVASDLQGLDGMGVLGPAGTLRTGPGTHVLVAASADELEGLVRAVGGPDAVALALSPTPTWLCHWLADERLADAPVAGYVAAEALTVDWARWAAARRAPHVLVPLGVPLPELAGPDEPAAAAAAAAHALELYTGPVFPSPRVIAAVLAGWDDDVANAAAVDDDPLALATWAQARRALPTVGAVVGMEAPRRPLEVPTAAFLAQRALLRAAAARSLAGQGTVTEPDVDDGGRARSAEILAGAASTLTDQESKVVLRGFGIEVTRQAVASSASGAVGFADRIGYPVVLKALSPDLRRRSDIGAIALDLPTAAAVRRAYADIVGAVERNAPTARLDGVAVAEMVAPGLDVRCGAVRLPGGAMALYGQVVDATVPIEPILALSPLSPARARLLAHAVLSRVLVPALRRDSDPDVEDLATLLARLDAVVTRFSDRLATIRLDPVRLCGPGRGAVVLDARVTQRPHLEGR